MIKMPRGSHKEDEGKEEEEKEQEDKRSRRGDAGEYPEVALQAMTLREPQPHRFSDSIDGGGGSGG